MAKQKKDRYSIENPTISDAQSAAAAAAIAASEYLSHKAAEKAKRQMLAKGVEIAGTLSIGLGLGSLFPPSTVVTLAYALIRAWRITDDIRTTKELIQYFVDSKGSLSISSTKESEFNFVGGNSDVSTFTAIATVVFRAMILNSIQADERTRPTDKYQWIIADSYWLVSEVYQIVAKSKESSASLFETWVTCAFTIGPLLQETRPTAFDSLRLWYDQTLTSQEGLNYVTDSLINTVSEVDSVREAHMNQLKAMTDLGNKNLNIIANKINAIEMLLRKDKSLSNALNLVETAGLSTSDRQSSLLGLFLHHYFRRLTTDNMIKQLPILPFGLTGVAESVLLMAENYKDEPFNNPPIVSSVIQKYWTSVIQTNLDKYKAYEVGTEVTLDRMQKEANERTDVLTLLMKDREKTRQDVSDLSKLIKKRK